MEKKIWFITGISSGLGKALAEEVIQQGDFVVGTFRRKTQMDAFNEKNKGNAIAYLLDVTQKKAIEETVHKIQTDLGKIDILVNNAGVGFAGAIEETSTAECKAIFEANFFGSLKITQTVLPIMRTRRSGHIIQISSHGGVKAFAGFGIYNASKFALEGFSEALAQEVATLGIKVSMVEPGPFRTEFAGESLGLAAREIDDYNETAGVFRTKLKRAHGLQEGDPSKAAKVIYQLAQQENPPLRIPLGKIALVTIGMKVESLKNDLEKSREIASDVVYN